jgi:hypothetical protein
LNLTKKTGSQDWEYLKRTTNRRIFLKKCHFARELHCFGLSSMECQVKKNIILPDPVKKTSKVLDGLTSVIVGFRLDIQDNAA